MKLFALGLLTAAGLFAAGCADVPVDHAPPAGAGAGVPATCGATPLAAGCTSKTNEATNEATSSTTSTSSAPPTDSPATSTCKQKTCETYQGACGTHDDGCGGTFSCGPCSTPSANCTPKTCADLVQSCGNHDNGCGGTVNCGVCATSCATDAMEPNDTPTQATDLGAFADTDNKTTTTPDLDSSDGDVDWFTIAVTDGWNFSNPTIDVTSSDALLQVSVFHECKSLPNYSYCYSDAGTQDNDDTLGNGCTAMGEVVLKTDCSGDDESGTAKIRVEKTVSDGSCHNYDLTVHVY